MNYQATIILENGTKVSLKQWQELYKLPVGSEYVGHFFSIGEKSFNQGLEIAAAVIRVLDETRKLYGVPLHVNSLDRTGEKQAQLKAQGYRTAGTSPHVYKMAADVDTVSKEDTLKMVELLKTAAAKLNVKIRVGYKEYLKQGNTFVHFDVCPTYYGPGGCFANVPVPEPWRRSAEW